MQKEEILSSQPLSHRDKRVNNGRTFLFAVDELAIMAELLIQAGLDHQIVIDTFTEVSGSMKNRVPRKVAQDINDIS